MINPGHTTLNVSDSLAFLKFVIKSSTILDWPFEIDCKNFNTGLFSMMDLNDINDLNEGSQSQDVASVDSDVFSMNEETREPVEMDSHIRSPRTSVRQRTSRLAEILIADFFQQLDPPLPDRMDHITAAAPESVEDVLDSLKGLVPEDRLATLRNAVRGQYIDVCRSNFPWWISNVHDGAVLSPPRGIPARSYTATFQRGTQQRRYF